jgi:serine/threonine protein kinase
MEQSVSDIALVDSMLHLKKQTHSADIQDILDYFNCKYEHIEYHFLVGEIKQVQGWILHISSIKSQITELLTMIIPHLLNTKVPFKIIKDKDTCREMLDGNLGYSQIGKVISIYPHSADQGLFLAEELIQLTKNFKGPAIPTDMHLGETVYTRYGGFNPIIMSDANGKTNKFIYDHQGQLILDALTIPFTMPKNIDWPFDSIRPPISQPESKILHGRYKPFSLLKMDPKGNVFKSLYLKNLFNVKTCVIKQGKKNMWSDDAGRDIADRLLWQQELSNQLADVVPMPKIFDLFIEGEDTYMTMEYIKGLSLYDHLTKNINKNCIFWGAWSLGDQLEVLDHLLNIIDILQSFHKKGYVHRDVTPVNFILDGRSQLVLIDIELSYCLKEAKPNPAFDLGTHGFISPEQMEIRTPTIKEDIYGLGATMITLLVGLTPLTFGSQKADILQNNLNFFIRDEATSKMIASCLEPDPAKRPSLIHIKNHTLHFKKSLLEKKSNKNKLFGSEQIDSQLLRDIIDGSILGLVTEPTVIAKDIWQSKMPSNEDDKGAKQNGFVKSGGLYEGITGIIYFLGRAHQSGFNISTCQKAYDSGWAYINNKYLIERHPLPSGLYGGAAGIALGLATSINAGLQEASNENRTTLQKCLEQPSASLDVATGAAGQGITVFQCRSHLGPDVVQSLLQGYIDRILEKQGKNGNWVMLQQEKGRPCSAASFSHGNTGITWFILEYVARYKEERARDAAIRSLMALKKLAGAFKAFMQQKGFRRLLEDPQTKEGYKGLILTFIKAYETLQEPLFKKLAEELLITYPYWVVHEDFTQGIGLSGIGELYLEAYRVFKNEEWKKRAGWIVEVLLHCYQKEKDNSIHWLTNNSRFPTADLMVGTSGIIHFLIRYFSNNQLNHILLA